MSNAAFTVKAFGVYLLFPGVALVLIPICSWVSLPCPRRRRYGFALWACSPSTSACTTGTRPSRRRVRSFWLRYFVRAAVPAIFVAFVAIGLARPPLVLFGIIDLSGGLWTFFALRKDKRGA